MTSRYHDLLFKSWNRDIYRAWKDDEISYEEAIFLAHRVEVGAALDILPRPVVEGALWVYDVIFEP